MPRSGWRPRTAMIIEVIDDGIGIAGDVPPGSVCNRSGSAARSSAGAATVTCPAAGGTVVRAWIPMLEGEVDD